VDRFESPHVTVNVLTDLHLEETEAFRMPASC
jgi:hypothetical protein